MILPLGIPPSPSAISRLREPVGVVSTFIFAEESPSFITAPFPNCFSICPRAASNAFNLSSFSITLSPFQFRKHPSCTTGLEQFPASLIPEIVPCTVRVLAVSVPQAPFLCACCFKVSFGLGTFVLNYYKTNVRFCQCYLFLSTKSPCFPENPAILFMQNPKPASVLSEIHYTPVCVQ